MTESKTETKTEIIRFVKVKGDTDILLQATFEKMMSEIADVRSRNLLRNHVEHYSQVEPYLNDTTLVGQWHGAGKISEVVIQNFFNKFYQAYLRIAGKGHKKAVLGLISMDYPFLEDKELEIVKSYLETQGHYPMLFIATRFLRRSKDRTTRIIARINGITGRHENMHALAEEYGLSRERIRQLSLKSIVESSPCPLVWSISRWEGYPFFHDPLLTTKNTDWENLRRAEHLEDIDFYSVLSIFSQLRSIKIVAVLADGTDILGRRGEDKGWDKAKIILAYDRRYNFFRFGNALAYIGHEVSLQRTTDKHLSLRSFVGEYIKYPFDEIIPQIANIMVEVLPLFKGVEIVGDDIILRANHTNYFEEIYQILLRKGEAMTVDEIFDEFKRLHPEDHHNDSNFVRSYMLRDKRIEAVGSKSTYQLREWGLFAGALSDLAVYLLQQSDEPMTANDLCRLMAAQRTNTTLNSCSTSIYLAVVDGRLLYYADAEKGTNFVGIADHTYDERFWASPVTVKGAVRSMHRFLKEKQRWPFSNGKTPIEKSLYYTMHKIQRKIHVTTEECQYYHEEMSDINSDCYPSNERELRFVNICKEFMQYVGQHKNIPSRRDNARLFRWYKETCAEQIKLKGCRKYYFEILQASVSESRKGEGELFKD